MKIENIYIYRFIFLLLWAVFSTGCTPTRQAVPSPTAWTTEPAVEADTAVPSPSATTTATASLPPTTPPTITPTAVPVVIGPAVVDRLAPIESSSTSFGTVMLAAAWNQSGDLLAVSSGETIQWFDPQSIENRQVAPVGVFSRALVFHPTRPELLLSGSNDGLVRIWNIFSAELQQALEANPKGINRLVISPDGSTLATAGNDALIYLWDLRDGTELEPLIGGAFAVPDLAFIAPESVGYQLVSVDGGVIRVRDVATSRLVISIRTGGPVQAIAVSPDGRQVAAARQEGLVQLWSLESGELLWEQTLLPKDEAWSLVFDPAGALLFSGWRSGELCWLLVEQPEQNKCQPAHTRPLGVLAFHPAGHTLLTGGYDGWLYFWQIKR